VGFESGDYEVERLSVNVMSKKGGAADEALYAA
jgi:hypothetical protein